jgi:hypothetical protein
MKTRLFEFIPDEQIHTVAYADCDILFGVEGCAVDLLAAPKPSWRDVSIKLTHYRKDGRGVLTDIHAGSFVVHREHSKELLRLWREQIARHTEEGDNDAFMVAYNRVKHSLSNSTSLRGKASNSSATAAAAAHVRHPMEPGMVLRPNAKNESGDRHWYEKFYQGQMGEFYCLNHMSKARCDFYGRKYVQEFVKQFRLRTFDADTLYCTSSWLKPLLYGWVPMGYLPGCPKLEELL